MKKFFTQLVAIVATLGLQKQFEDKTLSNEEMKSLIDAYNKAHGEGAFATDFAAFQEDQKAAKENEAYAAALTEIAGALGLNKTADAKFDMSALVESVKELKASVEKLGARAESDKPAATTNGAIKMDGVHTPEFAFGVQHPMFAAGRRWNQIAISGQLPTSAPSEDEAATLKKEFNGFAASLAARYQALKKSGMINRIAKDGVDFSGLANVNLNDRYYQIRQDMLIARIIELPSLKDIFPTVSNVQAGQIFTTLLARSVSQAYQSGRVFKGGVQFEPEKAIVDKAMAKIKFDDMSELELNYLNYLNLEGSDPVKWSMIEWIVLELAKQLNSERNERAVMGCRVEPTANVAGHERYASTGIVYRLLSYYWKDHKVLPFTSDALKTYTASTIGNVVQAFVEEVAKVYKGWKNVIVYMNENDKPLYSKWLETNFKTATNFVPDANSVPHYGNKIVWVPNMDMNFPLIFATIDKNLFLLENKPGEEFDMKFQRDLEEVICASYWKEGCGAGYAGIKKDSLSDLIAAGGKDQLIFMNYPNDDLAADATTCDADEGRIFITKANAGTAGDNNTTIAPAITDIENAVEGVVYHIECGSTTNATKIAKSGKFANIKSAFEPTAVGDWINVIYDATSQKFVEVGRSE